MPDIMNLFVETMREFQKKSEGMPIRLDRRILIWYYGNLDEIQFDWEDTDKCIYELSDYIFKISRSTNEIIFNTYLHIIYIDKLFDYYIKNSKEYALICSELLENSNDNEDKDTWLFDISLKDVADNSESFPKLVQRNKEIWVECSANLRNVLEKMTLFNPRDKDALNLSYVVPQLKLKDEG